MKLAYVIGSFPLRSETFIMREVLGLRRLGATVDVFSIRAPSASEMAQSSIEQRDLAATVRYVSDLEAAAHGWPRAALNRQARSLNRRFDKEATRKASSVLRLARAGLLARLFRQGRYNRIHAHWPYGSQLAALAHVITKIPLSVSVHAHEVAHDSGHFSALFQYIDFASFCNRAAMEYLLARLPSQLAGRGRLTYHGVNLDAFRPAPIDPPPPPLRILTAGRLTPTKGMAHLLRGLAAVLRRRMEADLTILGEGAERGRLAELASSLGIASRVHMPGWASQDELRTQLSRSHLFALLADSSYHDGLPNVVLEAQAMGRLVVLSPLPAASEAVINGHNGFILKSQSDPEEFADLVCALMTQPTELSRIGSAARTEVESKFDEQFHLRRLLALMTA